MLPQQLPPPSEDVRKGRRELLDALQVSDPHSCCQHGAVSPLWSVGLGFTAGPLMGRCCDVALVGY